MTTEGPANTTAVSHVPLLSYSFGGLFKPPPIVTHFSPRTATSFTTSGEANANSSHMGANNTINNNVIDFGGRQSSIINTSAVHSQPPTQDQSVSKSIYCKSSNNITGKRFSSGNSYNHIHDHHYVGSNNAIDSNALSSIQTLESPESAFGAQKVSHSSSHNAPNHGQLSSRNISTSPMTHRGLSKKYSFMIPPPIHISEILPTASPTIGLDLMQDIPMVNIVNNSSSNQLGEGSLESKNGSKMFETNSIPAGTAKSIRSTTNMKHLQSDLFFRTLSTVNVRYEDSDDEDERIETVRAHRRALEILSRCDPKPVVVVDLDYTIWPAYCYEQTLPPYRQSIESDERDLLDVKDQIFCVCRKTHAQRTLSLYSQVKSIFEFCADNGIVLSIASRSTSLQIVQQILTQFGIWDWFLFPQVYNTRKTYHFRNLSEATGLSMNNFLFFDDEVSNINMVTKMGVLSCLVDKEKGVNWDIFLKGITMFYAKQRASKSLRSWLSRPSLRIGDQSKRCEGRKQDSFRNGKPSISQHSISRSEESSNPIHIDHRPCKHQKYANVSQSAIPATPSEKVAHNDSQLSRRSSVASSGSLEVLMDVDDNDDFTSDRHRKSRSASTDECRDKVSKLQISSNLKL